MDSDPDNPPLFEQVESEKVQIYTISKTVSPVSTKGKSVLRCDLCEFKTNWKVNLTRHRNSIHFSTVYKCESCDYVATRLTTLNTHKKTAHEGCVYFCDQCSFSATWKQTLKRHKASKHEMKRFPCDYCDFTATRREHLKNHEKSSHLGQVFSCSLCPFKAKWKSNLNRHVDSIHSGVKYSCIDCSYKTNLKMHLKHHISRKHTVGKLEQCSFCSYTATTKEVLKKHMKNRHQNSVTQEAREELYKRKEENELTHFLELNSADEGAVFYLSEDVNGTRILEEMNPNPSLKLSTFSLNPSIELDPEHGEYLISNDLESGNLIRVVFDSGEDENGKIQ